MRHKSRASSFTFLALLVFLGLGALNPRTTAADFGLTLAGTYYVTQGDDPDFQIVTLTYFAGRDNAKLAACSTHLRRTPLVLYPSGATITIPFRGRPVKSHCLA